MRFICPDQHARFRDMPVCRAIPARCASKDLAGAAGWYRHSARCGVVLLAGLFFLFPSWARADETYDPLRQDLGPVKPFNLETSAGKTFEPRQLRGKVWVVHFFYTTCTGGCTKTAPNMAALQRAFAGNKRDVALVSISLNDDSPEDLRRYASDLGADPEQWTFLTGPASTVHPIVQAVFFQTAQLSGFHERGKEVDHSFHFVLVDGAGEIRGYVDGSKLANIEPLEKRIRELARGKFLLAAVNAILNTLCAVLLVLGYVAIRARWETLHKVLMLSALVASIVFLGSYLFYHFVVLDAQPTRFQGIGWIRPVYFGILLTHTALAALVAPLALYVAYQGLRDRRPRHVRVARWTLPIWLYVSITGVVVYWMLYHLYPPI
jgi:protein SCO1/2